MNEQTDEQRQDRKSLIDKYKKETNNSEISYTSRERSNSELDRALKKRKKMIYIGIGIAILLAIILTIVLCVTLNKGDEPSPNPTPNPPLPTDNPYYVSATDNSQYGVKSMKITRDKSANSFNSSYVKETTTNKFIDEAAISASLSSYSSVRLQIYDSQNPAYQVSSEFLNQDTDSASALNFNDIGFSLESLSATTSANDAKSKFNVKIYDKSTQNVYIDTVNTSFYLMSHFQEMSFNVRSQRLFGLGEKNGNFYLQNGTYVIYPSLSHDYQNNNLGSHPFLMMQLNNSNYFGIYVMNSNPMEVDIALNEAGDKSVVTFRTIGGILDFHFFYGPEYKDVVQQFQQLVGFPKMLPLWAHGFFAKSFSFNDSDGSNATHTFQKFSIDMPIEGVALAINSLTNATNLAYKDLVSNILKKESGMKVILPFIPVVPNTTNDTKHQLNRSSGVNLTVKSQGKDLTINIFEDINGYCMDVFNPEFGTDYIRNLMGYEDIISSGYWLEMNLPLINETNTDTDSTTNPFADLPFTPGNLTLFKYTLPANAQHNTTTNSSEYHFNLHSLYGSEMAKQFKANLPETEENKAFVLSDSTYPGLGQYGIGHVLQGYKSQYSDLKVQLGNMMKFGTYGIQNVGPNICGWTMNDTDEELCARYFQLLVISPLAFYNNYKFIREEAHFPYEFAKDYYNSVVDSLTKRMQYLIYMRTELYKIEKNGGSLIRPLISEYSMQVQYDQDNFTSVMFGDHVMVDFSFEQNQTYKDILLPDTQWVNLQTLETYKEGSYCIKNISFGTNYANLFQYGKSTIIPYQNTTKHKVTKTSDLQNVPISLSVALYGFKQYQEQQINYQAFGQVLIEDGLEDRNEAEFYEIQASKNIIAFRQQNSGKCQNDHTKIEQIVLSFLDKEVDFVCVLKRDLKSVQKLYTQYNETRKQAILTPNDPTNSGDSTTIKINEIAYIFYGYSNNTLECSPSVFATKVASVQQNDTRSIAVTLTSSLSQIYTGVPNPTLNVTLLTDNSLHFTLSTYSKIDTNFETPTDIYDRNFTMQVSSNTTYNISEIVNISSDPFYLLIVNPQNKSEIIFSTQDQIIFQSQNLFVFNFLQPASNGERFFGIGERKGDFFLQNNYTYALYNNQNNLVKAIQHERVVDYGKNGFYPIIYSQLSNSTNLTAMIIYTTFGQEISFYKNSTNPRMSVVFGGRELEFSFIFNLTATSSVESVFNHTQLGSLLMTQDNKFRLPPPEWSFGINVLIQNVDDITTFVKNYKSDTKWPLEGLIIDIDSLEQDQSFTLNSTRFTTDVLTSLKNDGVAIYTISKSGFAINKTNAFYQYLDDNDLFIDDSSKLQQSYEAYYGYDESGKVAYADYSVNLTIGLVDMMVKNFTKSFTKFGVQLKNNEITRKYCESGTCITNDATYRDLFSRPGCVQQTINTPGTAFMDLGTEESIHNVNGLMEQFAYANSSNHSQVFVLSESTSMGSGKLGYVGRSMDYYDITPTQINFAVADIQRMSVLGMPLVGVQFSNGNVASSVNATLARYAERMALLQAFTPITVQHYYPDISQKLQAENITTLAQRHRIRYMMMKYTRTEVFKQINFGTPFIRPLFFETNETDTMHTIQAINDQYMYGPSMMFTYNMTANGTFPPGAWCSLAYFTEAPTCVASNVSFQASFNSSLYIKHGTITLLHDVLNTTTVTKVSDLDSLTLDLHVFSHYDTNTASGQLLIESYNKTKSNDYCYQKLEYSNGKLVNTNYTTEVGGSGTCQENGYKVGRIYFYNAKYFNIANAKINGVSDTTTATDLGDTKVFTIGIPLLLLNIQSVEFTA